MLAIVIYYVERGYNVSCPIIYGIEAFEILLFELCRESRGKTGLCSINHYALRVNWLIATSDKQRKKPKRTSKIVGNDTNCH